MKINKTFKKRLINYCQNSKLTIPIILTIAQIICLSNKLIPPAIKSCKTKFLKDIVELVPIIKCLIPNIYIRVSLLVFTCSIWLFILYIRYFYEEQPPRAKTNIHVLGHSTLGKSQFKLSNKKQQDVNLIIQDLNLISDVEKIGENYKELKYVLNKQDDFIKSFKNSINNNDKYGYMGISHPPLILRAGYLIGDETKFITFHKYRNSDYYEELNDSELYDKLKIENKIIKDNAKELIVAISTTFQIEDNQLDILHPENKSIIKFRTEKLGYDVITSKKQAEDYINFILNEEVRPIVSSKGIEKIHMVISSSVSFTFLLGQSLSNNYDKELIVYNFNQKYNWGLSVFKNFDECIVIT